MSASKNVSRRGRPDYWVYDIESCLSPAECQEVIRVAKQHGLHNSEVYGSAADSVNNEARISETAWLPNNKSPIVEKVSRLCQELTLYPIENMEDLQVVRYPPGGFFKPHYDCCDGGPDECRRMNAQGGPRRVTMIIYLNDDYQGGETMFPKMGFQVVPKTGKAVVFWSTTDTDEVIRDSFHGGNPVIGGEKWICNKWLHPMRYN